MDALMNLSFFHSNINFSNDPCFLFTSSSGNGEVNVNNSNCSVNVSLQNDNIFIGDIVKPRIFFIGKTLFAYLTPVIILVGLVGNGLSLIVFSSKSMKKISASTYLAALSIADISTLMFYVLIEWLRRGLPHISPESKLFFLDTNVFCQTLLYMSYIARFMSSWTIVVFTIERFMGVCYPLESFKRGAKKIIIIMLGIVCCLVVYKPILSGENTLRGRTACSSDPEYKDVSFVLDSIFAFSITLVPFVIITVLNILIVRKLFLRNLRQADLFSDDTKIRLEFTLILLAISFFFIAFNLPYFTVWFRNFIKTENTPNSVYELDYSIGVLDITRTIFYLNYCVNFFLYSITGAYFRKELMNFLCLRRTRKHKFKSHIRCTRFGSSSTQMTTGNSSLCATYSA